MMVQSSAVTLLHVLFIFGEQGKAAKPYILMVMRICFDDTVDGTFIALLADNTRLTANDLQTYLANNANSNWLCAPNCHRIFYCFNRLVLCLPSL